MICCNYSKGICWKKQAEANVSLHLCTRSYLKLKEANCLPNEFRGWNCFNFLFTFHTTQELYISVKNQIQRNKTIKQKGNNKFQIKNYGCKTTIIQKKNNYNWIQDLQEAIKFFGEDKYGPEKCLGPKVDQLKSVAMVTFLFSIRHRLTM